MPGRSCSISYRTSHPISFTRCIKTPPGRLARRLVRPAGKRRCGYLNVGREIGIDGTVFETYSARDVLSHHSIAAFRHSPNKTNRSRGKNSQAFFDDSGEIWQLEQLLESNVFVSGECLSNFLRHPTQYVLVVGSKQLIEQAT